LEVISIGNKLAFQVTLLTWNEIWLQCANNCPRQVIHSKQPSPALSKRFLLFIQWVNVSEYVAIILQNLLPWTWRMSWPGHKICWKRPNAIWLSWHFNGYRLSIYSAQFFYFQFWLTFIWARPIHKQKKNNKKQKKSITYCLSGYLYVCVSICVSVCVCFRLNYGNMPKICFPYRPPGVPFFLIPCEH